MKNHIRGILIVLLFGLCLPNLQGQNVDYITISDSLLYHKNIDGALNKLSLISPLSAAEKVEIDLRRDYLTVLSEYRRNFNGELFPIAKSAIDSILVNESFSASSKKIYLYHFISSFSKSVLDDAERLRYCEEGLLLVNATMPMDTMFMIHFLFEKGSSKSNENKDEEAIKDFDVVESLYSNYSKIDSNFLAKIYYKLGFAHQGLDNRTSGEGYKYLLKSEQYYLALKHPDTFALAQVYGMLSDVAWEYRDYENGLNYVKKYKELNRQIDLDLIMSPLDQIQSKYHFYYKEMQFYREDQQEEALALLDEAESGYSPYKENHEIKLSMAAIYNLVGELYIRSEPEKSFTYYEKAIKTLNETQSAYHLQYLFNLGKSALYSGKTEESLKYATELVEVAETHNNSNLPHFYFLKAFSYIKLNNFEKAVEISNQVIQYMQPGNTVDLITHANLNSFNSPSHRVVSINLLSRMGMAFLDGFPSDPEALSVANALFQMGIMEYGKSIKATKLTHYTQSMYEQLVCGLINTQEYLKVGDLTIPEILEFSENTNEKYLWTIYKSNSDPNLFFDPELLAQEAQLRDELIPLKQKEIRTPSEDFQQQIFDINLQLERIVKKKRKSNSSYYDFEEAEFKFETFKSKVLPGVLVLKYEFILDSLYLFEISSDTILVKKVNTDDSFVTKIEQTYQMISDPMSDIDSLNELLGSLGELILPVIKNDISDLVIKPDGKLNFLPFDLLRRDDKYLIEDYNIGYINALGLYESGKQKVSVSNALIMSPSYNKAIENEGFLAVRGDEFDLSGALEEARLIGELLPGKVLLGENALKSSFREIGGNYDLLHFSMHSILNDADPELSNLAFHDGESDNKLYISELYGMRLNVQMAVLSACNTGIGEEVRGDGIVSLNRAFTFTGVASVVSSLWSAPDNATKEIMLKFYENLVKGEAKPEALRKAKIEYLSEQEVKRFKHPYFWAGFVIYGDPSPIEISDNKIKTAAYLLVAGIFILCLLILIYRKTIPFFNSNL